MKTINGQTVRLGQLVKTGLQITCEVSIIKKIDTEQGVVFVVPLVTTERNGGHGGWHSACTITSIN
tara:strand:- start:74 stop:271 length:198 start_codon:yes stop_codon:yes gene_type:complete